MYITATRKLASKSNAHCKSF